MFARRTVCRMSCLAALLAGMYSPETARADFYKGADLIYDPNDGWVTIDPSSTPTNRTISFVLESFTPTMTPISEDRLPMYPSGDSHGENSPQMIGYADWTFLGVEGPLDLGPVLPTEMEPGDLACYLKSAKSAWQLGRGGNMDLYVDGFPDPVTTQDCQSSDQGGGGGEQGGDAGGGIATAEVLYDADTGNVVLAPGGAAGDSIVSFELQTTDGQRMFPVSEERLAALGVKDVEIINEPGHIKLSGLSTDGGPLDLGPIFPAGLAWDQISRDLVVAQYNSSSGQAGELEITVVIPEPSAGVLICVGIMAMLTRRRFVRRVGTPRQT